MNAFVVDGMSETEQEYTDNDAFFVIILTENELYEGAQSIGSSVPPSRASSSGRRIATAGRRTGRLANSTTGRVHGPSRLSKPGAGHTSLSLVAFSAVCLP